MQNLISQNKNWLSRYGCHLIIFTEDDHPIIVNDYLNIPTCKIYVKGESYIQPDDSVNPKRKYLENMWELSSSIYYTYSKEQSVDLLVPVNEILEVIEKYEDEYMKVVKLYPAAKIMLFSSQTDFHTYFFLENKIIQKISNYGLSFEFDEFYYHSE